MPQSAPLKTIHCITRETYKPGKLRGEGLGEHVVQARFGLLGVKDEAFPRIKLFKKGQDTAKPVDYTGSMKDSSELLAWTVAQTGVFVGVKVRPGLQRIKPRGEAQHGSSAAAVLKMNGCSCWCSDSLIFVCFCHPLSTVIESQLS